jgi:predicted enzyme related to lactoylglutathione lyase
MPGTGADPKPGQFSWHELYATDVDAAFDFYNALFGWNRTESMDMGDMGVYQMYGIGEVSLGGMMKKPDEMPGPPSWLYYVLVDDLDASVEKIKSGGGQVINGPMPIPGGDRIVQAMDPQGAMFAIHGKGGG